MLFTLWRSFREFVWGGGFFSQTCLCVNLDFHENDWLCGILFPSSSFFPSLFFKFHWRLGVASLKRASVFQLAARHQEESSPSCSAAVSMLHRCLVSHSTVNFNTLCLIFGMFLPQLFWEVLISQFNSYFHTPPLQVLYSLPVFRCWWGSSTQHWWLFCWRAQFDCCCNRPVWKHCNWSNHLFHTRKWYTTDVYSHKNKVLISPYILSLTVPIQLNCFVATENLIILYSCQTTGGIGRIGFSCGVDNTPCEATVQLTHHATVAVHCQLVHAYSCWSATSLYTCRWLRKWQCHSPYRRLLCRAT